MSRSQRLRLAVALNLALVVGEVIAALIAHSTSLLADAGHNLADAAGLVLAFIALRLAARAPTSSRSFGFHRATILSALMNVAFLLVTTTLIGIIAINRLEHPLVVRGSVIALSAGIATLVNGLGAFVVAEPSGDLNMKSAFLHQIADAAASFGVFVAGLIEMTTGRWSVLDPAVSLGIGLLIVFEAIRLGRASIEVLLEASPADIDLTALTEVMSSVPGVLDVHDLHVWSLSSEVRALSAHVVLGGQPSLEAAQKTADAVRQAIIGRFSIAHATLELESDPCEADDVTLFETKPRDDRASEPKAKEGLR